MFDMAVGVIIGAAFTAIITSIVTHLATPIIGILIGVDFKAWKIMLPRLYGNAEPGVLEIGLFVNSIINFVVVALTVFLFIKALNKFRKKQEEAPPPPPEPTKEVLLLTEIRDLLKEGSGNKSQE
jgi:large conductance mechanosensitive channel